MPNSPDVLNLEWTSLPHRDRESATLICNYLRLQGLSVYERSIHQGYALLKRFRPRILLMTNTIGSVLNVRTAEFAKSLGIPVVATISEGLFYDGWEEQMFWGANRGKVSEDLRLLWSETSRQYAARIAPQFISRLGVSGSVGADRFVMGRVSNRVRPRRASDALTVGFGCFDFGFVEPSHGYHSQMKAMMGDAGITRYASDRQLLNSVLAEAVRQNPAVRFLIKEHPGAEGNHARGAISGLEQFPNVEVVLHQRSLTECIAECDIWLSYESTTSLEAWLMGMQTAVVNPSGTDLPFRHSLWQGQPNLPTAQSISRCLKELRATGQVPGFSELAERRAQIVEDVVQWSDGLNHVRVGNALLDYLKRDRGCDRVESPDLAPPHVLEQIRQKISWTKVQCQGALARKIPIMERDRRFWDYREVAHLSSLRLGEQRDFYGSLGYDLDALRTIRAN